MRKKSDRHHMVVVATPGTPVFELAIPCEVFGVDRGELTDRWYDFELVASAPRVQTSLGLQVPEGRGLTALSHADTVVVPACGDVHAGADEALVHAVRRAHRRGARIASVCSGAFVLAQAGLLDGRRATTHWMHAAELAARHPRVEVDPAVLYVHDDVWTSAGSAAAIDMCLELVRADLGATVANEVARRMVVPPHRSGGQAQFVRPRRPAATAQLSDALDWARRHLDTATVAGLARRAGVSPRTLHRSLTRDTGCAPQEWLLRERLAVAQELLESTDLTVDAIAARTGMGTAANLRAHFARSAGVSPSQYRTTFRTRAAAAS